VQQTSYAIPQQGEEFHMDFARAFLAGYTSERPLSHEEWLYLPNAMLFSAIFTVLWYSMVYAKSWRCTRYILNHREEIAKKLQLLRTNLP
jgi:Ser/Thr protein kinase RdoA (MazF antagonist)